MGQPVWPESHCSSLPPEKWWCGATGF